MRSGDRVLVESVGGHAFVDPFLPVVVLVNHLRHGPGLRAGQLVATGLVHRVLRDGGGHAGDGRVRRLRDRGGHHRVACGGSV